jgi:hypothetical protein
MANSRWSKKNREDGTPEPATPALLKPGNFELGSPASRAAARAMAESRKEDHFIQIVYVSPDGTKTNGPRLTVRGVHRK